LRREPAFTAVCGLSWVSGAVKRISRAALCGVAALSFAAFGAVKAAVTDVSGQVYNVTSMRLAKGSTLFSLVTGQTLTVYCGGARMELPLKNVRSMKINPKRISPIEGRLHFGVELLLRDSTVVGGGGLCYIPADNGISGKSLKGKISLPFEKLRYVYILGKEDAEKNQPPKEGGAAENAEEKTDSSTVEANETEQPVKEDDGESASEQE